MVECPGRDAEAHSDVERAMLLDPDDPSPVQMAADAFAMRGDHARAIPFYERCGFLPLTEYVESVRVDAVPRRDGAVKLDCDNKLDLDTVITTGPHTPGMAKLDTSVVDFDLQRTIGWGSHQIVTGLNVRKVLTDSSVILGSREEETLVAPTGFEPVFDG